MTDARTCNEIHSLMADWLDGELSAALTARVDEHLTVCGSCREAFDQMRAMGGDLALLGLAGDRMSESAAQRVPATPTWRRAWVQAAAVAILLTGGVYLANVWRGDRALEPFVERVPEQMGGGSDVGAEEEVAVVPAGECRVEGRTAVAMASANPRVRIVWLYEDAGIREGSTPSSGGVQPRPQG